MATYFVTLESDNYGTTEPVDSAMIEATDQREAEKMAARGWSLKPHQWCFEHSPFRVQAVEDER